MKQISMDNIYIFLNVLIQTFYCFMKNNTHFEFDGSNIAQKKLEARKG